MTGALWRDVANLLGEEAVLPHIYLPLIEMVAERHAGDGYFLQWIPKNLTDPQDRADLDRDLRYAAIGHEIYEKHKDALLQWANTAEDGPYDSDFVTSWWLDTSRDIRDAELDLHAMEHCPELLERLQLAPNDMSFLRQQINRKGKDDYRFLVRQLRHHHHWAVDLDILRDLVHKTWPAKIDDRQLWDAGELGIVEEYYADQQPDLVYEGSAEEGADPFRVRPANRDQSLGMGMGELSYCMTVILRSTFTDFMDEILEHSRFPQVRGSLRCVECGYFVGRRALGYGQLYCGQTCKKRAAKRRYRLSVRILRRRPSQR